MQPVRLLLLLAAMLLLALTSPPAQAGSVGFQLVSIEDPGNPPIEAGIWYPTSAKTEPHRLGLEMQDVAISGPIAGGHLPLIVMSHGQGGIFSGQLDLATALASAGFVAAALTHTGDNYLDQSRVLQIWDRTRQLHVAADWLLATWPGRTHLDPSRIGAFGFSAGAFTVLVAAGGTPDLARIGPHCQAVPTDFVCGLIIRNHGVPGKGPVPPGAWVHDPRIKAAVVAAPALGFTFDRQGLSPVHIPIQLWRGTADHILPQPYYAEAVARALPAQPDYQVVQGADHFDFLPPCNPVKAHLLPQICTSSPGFDRAAFHARFNAAVVAFFEHNLPGPSH